MSTSIDELISETNARQGVYEAVRARFPNAHTSSTPDGERCIAADGVFADSVQFMAAKDGRVYGVLYVVVSMGHGLGETVRVYERDSLSMPYPAILLALDDVTRAALVKAVRRV